MHCVIDGSESRMIRDLQTRISQAWVRGSDSATVEGGANALPRDHSPN